MLWQLGGSIVGILAVSALVWYLGLGQAQLADKAQAQRLANDMLSGFKASEVILSNDMQAAVIIGADNSIALLKRHGAKFAARRLDLPVQCASDEVGLVIDSGEIAYGKLSLQLSPEKAKSLADRLLTRM